MGGFGSLFSCSPICITTISRTSMSASMHSWRLTGYTHSVSFSQILHPSGIWATFHGAMRRQCFCSKLHTVAPLGRKHSLGNKNLYDYSITLDYTVRNYAQYGGVCKVKGHLRFIHKLSKLSTNINCS